MHGTMARQNDSSNSGTITTTQQCTKVARVGDAINCNKKWLYAIARYQKFFNTNFGKRRRKCNNTLRRFTACSVFNVLTRNIGHCDTHSFSEFTNIVNDFVRVDVVSNPNFACFATAGNEQLTYSLTTFYLFST